MLSVIRARMQQWHRTMAWPGQTPTLPDRFRGLPVVDSAKCPPGCRECADACPTDAISFGAKGLRLDPGRCLFCTDCMEACPEDAIHYTQDYRLATSTRRGRSCGGLSMKLVAVCACWTMSAFAMAQTTYHTPPSWTTDLMKAQHRYTLLSPLEADDGHRMTTADEWNTVRRPKLLEQWGSILGKLQPDNDDQKWFGDITQSVEVSREKRVGYTRIELKLPMETDFLQPHLLLIPDNAQPGKCPAVIAWTSTGPDYAEPENWWGAWLAQHGCVVLTGWSFICNYRNETSFRNGVSEKEIGRAHV